MGDPSNSASTDTKVDVNPTIETKENINGNQKPSASNPNRNKNSNYTVTQPYLWKGKNEQIKDILALKSERYENKVLFSVFNDHLKNYIAQNYKFAHELLPIIDQYSNPKDSI